MVSLAVIGLAAAIVLPANPERQPNTPAEPTDQGTLDTTAGHA
jgi:hypothetical protein